MKDELRAAFISDKGRLLTLDERVDPRSTALIVVDVQNDFCDPAGAFGKLGADLSMMPAMADNLRHLIDAARRRAMLILWVRATYDAPVVSCALAETYHRRGFIQSQCLDGSWGAEWYGVSPGQAANEISLTKHRFSPFWDTAIDLYLRSNNIRSVVMTGVVTSGCVDSTARDAFFNDYYVIVAEDCVAEASQEQHTAALRKLAQSFGVVVQGAALISAWDASNQDAASWQRAAKQTEQWHDLPARLNPAHTALLLVDTNSMAFQTKTPANGLTQMQAAIGPTAALLREARAHRVRVVHIRTENSEASLSPVQLFLRHRVDRGNDGRILTPAAEFPRDLAPWPGETVLTKHRADCFVDTALEKWLRSNRIRTLAIAGAETHSEIDSTVRHAAMLDFHVIVLRDCIGARDDLRHLHDASLETMALRFADIRSSIEIALCWSTHE